MTYNDVMTPDPREERLPKWAREDLSLLRMRLREAKEREARYAGEMPDAVAFIRPYAEAPFPVARYKEAVMFHMDDDRIAVKVSERRGKRILEVMAYTDSLVVCPQSSNVVTMEVK